MTETKIVQLLLSSGETEACSLEITTAAECKLVFSGISMVRREFKARDLFEALISLRLVLEEIGARILCAGARRDVFPSGMFRDSGGRRAYVNRLGVRPGGEDLVDIFDPAAPEDIATVAEQRAFHAQ